MSLQDRVESLKAKHASLDAAIQSETRRPIPDTSQIKTLKREKLRIKDEIRKIDGTPH